MLKYLTAFVNRFRTDAILKAAGTYIQSGQKIIDIGAGSCHIAETLAKRPSITVTAVDVVDHNITELPLQLYDGKKLPFKAGVFDASLLIFVLHHADDMKGLLREALRVSETLILLEDTPQTRLEKRIWKWFDRMVNHEIHNDIAIAHHAMSTADWQQMLNEWDVEIVETRRFRSFMTTLGLYPHTVFVVRRR